MAGVEAVSTNAAITSVTIEGITFDGNRANYTGALQVCHIYRTNRAIIRNCRFRDVSTAENSNARAILVDTRSTAPEADIDIYFNDFVQIGDDTSNISNAILVASPMDRVRISHNTFDNTAVEARVNFITVGEAFGTGQTDAIIIGNEIFNFETGTALGAVGARGISVNYFNNVTISGNQIDATEGDGINVQDSHTVSVTGNIVKRGREGGIEVAGCKNVTVMGNTANENDNAGISCAVTLNNQRSFTGAANVVIDGNITLDNGQGGSVFGGIDFRSDASDVTAGANFVITCNVSGETRAGGARTQDYGINISTSSGNDPTWRDGLIANNKIYNNDLDGIRLVDVATCQVVNNVVLNNDLLGINIDSSTNVIVEGNRVAGNTTQDIKFQNTTTGSKLRFNHLPSGLRTAMSGITQMANTDNGAVATIPATGANPYIREGCILSVGYASKSTGRTMMQPTVATCQNGSISMFAKGHGAGHATFPGGTTTVYWTFIEGTSTA